MPGLPSFISVVNLSRRFDENDVRRAVSALNKQILRDFSPIWGVSAAVDFTAPDAVLPGRWVIGLVDENTQTAFSAIHGWAGNLPCALVEHSLTWTISLSHECLEMLADPFGQTRVPGYSLDKDRPGRVQFLVEVCDPCQSDQHAYMVDGVLMSDFYTPNYFDPVYAPGVRYCFNGGDGEKKPPSILHPRNVPQGGYLTWMETDTGLWWQFDNMGSGPVIRQVKAPDGALARMDVDRLTMRRERAFWKKRHQALSQPGVNFELFDQSLLRGSKKRVQEMLKALHKKKRKRTASGAAAVATLF